jgi:two-component system chemotaxis sensor kinase CheA
MSTGDGLRERLLATFKMEAREHLATLSSALMDLEASGAAPGGNLVETAFRVAHSLKGAARSVNLGQIESVCQAMESVFSGLKRGNLAFTREHADLLLHAVRVRDAAARAAPQRRDQGAGVVHRRRSDRTRSAQARRADDRAAAAALDATG